MKTENESKALTKKKNQQQVNFIDIIKKRWLISRTNTLLLIAILIAIFILCNTFIKSLKLTPIDCTANKQYTLTDESKNRTKDIQQTVNVYFTGIKDTDASYTLVKQYNKNNSNINVEIIDLNEKLETAKKYNLENNSQAIIVESGEKSKVISMNELYTYDSNYNSIDLTEEKITSAILNVTSDKIAKAYFLTQYTDLSFEMQGGLYYFSQYLNDEVLEYDTLDLLVSGSIPEDCSTLVILSPTKDFDELTTNEITKYINNGGNVLWLNASYAEKIEMPNVNKILAMYGINPFEVGYIYETNSKNIASGYPGCIVQTLGKTEIDSDLKNALLLYATKINYNTENLDTQKVTKTDLITTESTSYYRKDITNNSTSSEGDEQGGFTVAGIFEKTVSEGEEESKDDNITSKMVIFGDINFITDMQISNQIPPMILIYNNKDLALNSIAYLTDQNKDITIRKDYNSGVSSFTATDGQKTVIMRIIFLVPIAIIILGIIVWQVRKRKK